jgi:histidinol dehydrogenase
MTTTTQVLNRVTPDMVSSEIKDPVDPTALGQAKAIIAELMTETGYVCPDKLLTVAKRLGDVPADGTDVIVSKEDCKAAYESLSDQERTALVNIHARVKAFAEMQRKSVVDMEMDIPGGKAGHTVSPCKGELAGAGFIYVDRCMPSKGCCTSINLVCFSFLLSI